MFKNFVMLMFMLVAVSQATPHVLVIGIDGLGGMYLENATFLTPNIKWIVDSGTFTFRARNIFPTVSAPNWAAIITGMSSTDTGVNANEWMPSYENPTPTFPSMPPVSGNESFPQTHWQVAKLQNPNLTVAVSISWDWINYLTDSKSVDYLFRGHEDDNATTFAMSKFIVTYQPDLMFIHLDQVDDAGHTYEWGSPEYYSAVQNVDALIGQLLNSLKIAGILEDTYILVTADHGGWQQSHGAFMPCMVYVPALFLGPMVPVNQTFTTFVNTMDFAPTILSFLGLKQGAFMSGKALF
jgi:predicted AlkP superfamily pyrophosphatase or phosphodiesterase